MKTRYRLIIPRGLAAAALAGLLLSGTPGRAEEANPASLATDSPAPDSAAAAPDSEPSSASATEATDLSAPAPSPYDVKKTVVTGQSRAITRKESEYVARLPLKNL